MKTLNPIHPARDHLSHLAHSGSTARLAVALAAIALTGPAAHAAPTVWNVHINNTISITTGDNFVGAAFENTANSTWNRVTATPQTGMALADSTGSTAAGVTLNMTGYVFYKALTSGDKIFSGCLKGNSAPSSTMTINGLSPSDTYDVVIYSDWFWRASVGYPVTQTAGTGLTGTFWVNHMTGTNGTLPPLTEDTNPGNVTGGAGNLGNWCRIKGLTPDATGKLSFQLADGTATPNCAFNGFQLVKIDLADSTPPTPSPMTWATPPAATSPYSITMTATTASDLSGVEYQFTETSDNPGATKSDWQNSPVYTDTGLDPATTYTYTVTARDKSLGQNPTAASAAASATTEPADITPPTPNPAEWATLPIATGEASVTMTATAAADPNGVEYLFTVTSANPGGTSSSWQNSPTYTDTGLTPGTTYQYTVTARDKSPAQNETTASTAESVTTDPADTTAPTPDPMTFDTPPAAASIASIIMTATTASDVNGAEYYFTETSDNSGGSDSGWQDSPVYVDGGLTPGMSYTYKVKARDKSISQNTTADSATASATTTTELIPSKVWNVNVASTTPIATGDNFVGAAAENTLNSTWNSVTSAPQTGMALADSTGASTAGVSLALTGSVFTQALLGGDKIFSGCLKGNNGVNTTLTIKGLSMSKTYDVVIYSDWYWRSSQAYPVTQTAGTGLAGTVWVDHLGGTNGTVPPLTEDTDPANNGTILGNWYRIKGLTPNASGQLGFQLADGTPLYNCAFNGFQLVDTTDTTAPTPDPMTWASVPAAAGESSITMTATTASDASGVEYFFDETSSNPGGTDSGWQDSPVYTDTGLTPLTSYTYTVTARDKSPAQSATAASDPASATTLTNDLIAPTPDPMSFATPPAAASITKIIMTAITASDASGVEYYFTETSGNSGGSDSGWQDSPVYTDGGLTPGTSYTYTVKARDKSLAQNTTADSASASASTDPETVVSSVWNVNIGSEVTASDNFAGAAPENTVPNSFWNSVTTANPAGLALADSTASTSAGVTLDLTGSIGYADFAPITGPEIFSSWIKSTDNVTPFTMTIGGLSFSKTYDLIVYSDWFWKGNGTLPLTLTAGTGLSGTVTLDQISTGTNGVVLSIVQDTDLAANSSIQGNWIRINGLTPDANGNLAFLMGGTNAAFSGFQLVRSTGGSTFATWAAANAGGQTAGEDFDNDGVDNGIEYFMGQTGSSFTAMPGLDATNKVTWPMDPAFNGTYEVQTSPDLATWTNVDPRPLPAGGNLSYTLPSGLGTQFVRLLVTPAP